MVFRKRAQKDQSVLDAAKDFAKKFLAVSLLLAVAGCGGSSSSRPSPSYESVRSSDGKSLQMTPFGLKITTLGENHSPSFNANSQKILFISKTRDAHKQAQVYEFDLNNLTEKRITFQDGDCGTPIFTADGNHLLYTSTTDELKERPPILDVAKKTENGSNPENEPAPFDIYKSDLAGAKIERLTNRAGYDGDLFLRPDRPSSVVFSQWKNKKWDQYQLNADTKAQIPLLEKAQFSVENMRLSPKAKYWVWIEKSTVNKSYEVILAKTNLVKERALPLSDYEIESLTWGNDEVIIASMKLPNEKFFQIYSFDIMSGCLAPLIKGKADLLGPKVSQDEKSVIFSAEENGKSHIYLKSVGLIAPTCI